MCCCLVLDSKVVLTAGVYQHACHVVPFSLLLSCFNSSCLNSISGHDTYPKHAYVLSQATLSTSCCAVLNIYLVHNDTIIDQCVTPHYTNLEAWHPRLRHVQHSHMYIAQTSLCVL